MGKLEGKVALVTGSGRNIGRATVLKLAAAGAHVVVNSRPNQADAEAVEREAQAPGGTATAVVAGVARKDQVVALAMRAVSECGRRGIAVNCLFLVTDDGGFITEQTIHANGGVAYY